MATYCCDKFERSIRDEDIFKLYSDKKYKIHGKPEGSDDGDGHYDDMTEDIEIDFCPFCGAKVNV